MVGVASTLRARTPAEMAVLEAETDAFLSTVPPLPGLPGASANTPPAAVVARQLQQQQHSAHGVNSANSELSALSLSDTATPPLEISGSADQVDAHAVGDNDYGDDGNDDDDDDEMYMPLSVVSAVNECEADGAPLAMSVNIGGIDSPRATNASTPSSAPAIAKMAMAAIVDILVDLFIYLLLFFIYKNCL